MCVPSDMQLAYSAQEWRPASFNLDVENRESIGRNRTRDADESGEERTLTHHVAVR
jgi:hypothetical protein